MHLFRYYNDLDEMKVQFSEIVGYLGFDATSALMGNTVVRITVDTLHLQLHFANWPRRVTVTVIFHRQSSPSTVSFSAARGQSTILGAIRIFHRIW